MKKQINTLDMGSGYFNLHKNKINTNPHHFLCEELLVPRASNSDTQRINMFSNHLMQLVQLKTPEIPKVFTRFENQIGSHSIAHKEAKDDFTIIDKIYKNKNNYLLIIQYRGSKVYDVIEMKNCRNISESYGYALNDCISDKNVGDVVSEGTQIYRSNDYDEDGNLMYGVNLKAVYLSWNNMTYEDGVIISESAAKKLTSYKVEQTEVSVNSNDVMINLYGNENFYKSFPKVGDHTTSKVLLALRRIDYGKSMYDLQDERMREIDPINDEIIYTDGGEIVDIDFYCNLPLEQLKKRNNEFSRELVAMIEDQYKYYEEVAKALEKIIPIRPKTQEESELEKKKGEHVPVMPVASENNPNKYSDDLAFMWKLSHEYIDDQIRWREDGKSFENIKIKFTILKENPLVEGCKITGRYGNKGIISQVVADDEMPKYLDSKGNEVRAEICLNPLGVINRLNLSQIQEQYINFMSDHLVEWLKEHERLQEREEEFFKYMKFLNKEEADFLELEYIPLNRTQKEEFFEDIIEHGVYVHQYPFVGNPQMEVFKQIFLEMPELCTEYHFENIERPMVMGDLYFVRLKHESTNKSSIRSTSQTNIRNLPAKNTLKKTKRVLTSSTPIRLGEMESTNLMVSRHPELVEKILKYYSTSEEARELLVDELLTSNDPFNLDLPQPTEKSTNRQILDKYLNLLELQLEDSE